MHARRLQRNVAASGWQRDRFGLTVRGMDTQNATPTLAAPRAVSRVVRGQAAADGAGVRLVRFIGTPGLPDLDPFLLLDAFGSERADDYIAGFPDHPHRGFETVTYMLDGRMRHRDSRGHEGVIGPGGVQWMRAGRGIVHSEMPEQDRGLLRGFQLWLNLPAADKMSEPGYQEFEAARIPEVQLADRVRVRVIAGEVAGTRGVIGQGATEAWYLDLRLPAHSRVCLPLPSTHRAFAQVFEGRVVVEQAEADLVIEAGSLAVLGEGDGVVLRCGEAPAAVLLVAGRPLHEPVARHGPFVMNTHNELMQAFADYRAGRLGR